MLFKLDMFNCTVKTECQSSFENDAGVHPFLVLLSIIASCATSRGDIYYYLSPFEKKWLAKESALSKKNFLAFGRKIKVCGMLQPAHTKIAMQKNDDFLPFRIFLFRFRFRVAVHRER